MEEAKYRLFVVVFFNRLFITIYYCFLQPQTKEVTKESNVYPKYWAINPIFWLLAYIYFYVLFSSPILIENQDPALLRGRLPSIIQ